MERKLGKSVAAFIKIQKDKQGAEECCRSEQRYQVIKFFLRGGQSAHKRGEHEEKHQCQCLPRISICSHFVQKIDQQDQKREYDKRGYVIDCFLHLVTAFLGLL